MAENKTAAFVRTQWRRNTA